MEGCFSPKDLQEGVTEFNCPPRMIRRRGRFYAGGREKVRTEGYRPLERFPQDLAETGPHAPLKGAGDDIWHPSEALDTQNAQDYDPRQVPEYEMKFKQAVTAEDVYLGMGFKTPSTASCEWLSVLVKLPQETREKVELSVESEAIDVRSPRYRLHLPTLHPVDPNASSAKWHNDTSTLEITLKLARELDGINF
ncbi:protein PIH1D3 [Nylanderia fulva]|uniref:protein PIH1D3 n=1 Tax=Nylanderia fulva TaxID=613905 RepID=UPI0010FAEEDC|nr:protein PIH1D3 [Nylanderia fulva]